MTEHILLWAALLLVITFTTYMAQRTGLPTPVALVVTGLALSWIPHTPQVRFDPDVVLNAVLPLLVYTGAVVVPWHDLRRNLRPVGVLSIGLVIFTTCGVTLLARLLFPDMPWAAALLLGAVISPPDEVAASMVMKRIPIPRRVITILEGEGLINDVTALTIFRFALVGVAGGTVSAVNVSLGSSATLVGGALNGWLVGWLALKLRQLFEDTHLEITVSLITPFAAYLLPEHLGVTGVLSTVVAGVYVSAKSPRMISADTRLQAHQLWLIVSFWLNSVLFLALGLQFKQVAATVSGISLSTLILLGAVFSVSVIVLRFVWVFPAAYLPRMISKTLRHTDPVPPLRHLFLLSYTGMRGAISMAAVLSIPPLLPDNTSFAYRDIIVFITFSVILVTLVVQGLLLPIVVRLLGIEHEVVAQQKADRLAVLQTKIAAAEAGIRALNALGNTGQAPVEVSKVQRLEREKYVEDLKQHVDAHANESVWANIVDGIRVRKLEIEAERVELVRLLREDRITERALIAVEHDLDLREAQIIKESH